MQQQYTVRPQVGDEAVSVAVEALKDIAGDAGNECARDRLQAASLLLQYGVATEFTSGSTEDEF